MASSGSVGAAGSDQRYGSQGHNSGEYHSPNAAVTLVDSQHDSADAPVALGEYDGSHAALALGQHDGTDAAFALELTAKGSR